MAIVFQNSIRPVCLGNLIDTLRPEPKMIELLPDKRKSLFICSCFFCLHILRSLPDLCNSVSNLRLIKRLRNTKQK